MRLFVYGTLLADSGTAPSRWLQARVRGAAQASVPGRLVAIPADERWYPALVRGGAGDRVRGTVCDLEFAPGDLSWLDAYEGHAYRREAARALLDRTGLRATVYLYRWRIALPVGAKPLARGDFLAWLHTSRARVYAPR